MTYHDTGNAKEIESFTTFSCNKVPSHSFELFIGNRIDGSMNLPIDETQLDNLDILRKQIEKVKEEEDLEVKSELLEKLLLVSNCLFHFYDRFLLQQNESNQVLRLSTVPNRSF